MLNHSKLRRPAAGFFLAAALAFAGWQVARQIGPGDEEEAAMEAEEGPRAAGNEIPGAGGIPGAPPEPAGEGTVLSASSGTALERPARNPFQRSRRRQTRAAAKRLPPLPDLQGIRGGDSPAAWLSGEFVQVGDTVMGWKVAGIEDDRVRLSGPGGVERIVETP